MARCTIFPLIQVYLYSSLHIATAGAAMYYILYSPRPQAILESIAIGLLIFCYYNLSRIIRIRDYDKMKSNKHLLWVSNNLTELVFSLGFAALFLIILFGKLGRPPRYYLIVWLLFFGSIYPLCRTIPYLKNGIIAATWCLLFGLYNPIPYHWFLYILALSIWYDFKDLRRYPLSKKIIWAVVFVLSTVAIYPIADFTFLSLMIWLVGHFSVFFLTLYQKSEWLFLFAVDLMMPMAAWYITSNF